jgi:hypothetical protein
MSYTLSEIRKLPTEQLIKEHDTIAQHTQVGVDYYLRELARRDQEAIEKAIKRYTVAVAVMTFVIMAATLVLVIRGG